MSREHTRIVMFSWPDNTKKGARLDAVETEDRLTQRRSGSGMVTADGDVNTSSGSSSVTRMSSILMATCPSGVSRIDERSRGPYLRQSFHQ